MSVLLVSLDSFFASMALALFELPVDRQQRMCCMFVLCDGLATLTAFATKGAPLKAIGPLLAHLSPAMLPLCVSLVLVITAYSAAKAGKSQGALMVAVPILLSLDNLMAGVLADSVSAGLPGRFLTSLAAGITSGAFALLGFTIGARLKLCIPRVCAHAAAVSLVILPVIFW
ncbi:MAG: hypothetical protein LAP39_21430 [Acidobacteriia bacterium]|nr:hypothetical protein [Terriglobia bacterium]